MSTATAAATRTRPALSMKLLIDTKARRVLFAEAGKDVVDFLFSLLALPVGTAVRLLGTESMVGSTGHLYASVEKLDATYVLPGADLDALLRPAVSSRAAASNTSLLRLQGTSAPSNGFFWCGQNHGSSYYAGPGYNYVTGARGTKCPGCGEPMTDAIYWAQPGSGRSGQAAAAGSGTKGFVQGVVTYTVTDNLNVTPMSAISSMTLLTSLGVRDFGALQEKTVRLGSREGLAILKASLKSKTVLTDVFLASRSV
uniref:Uncharacterized protein n=1 Tax=Avena sativa TaxID=4498 RepID=A0ACD5VNQ4_AVESA